MTKIKIYKEKDQEKYSKNQRKNKRKTKQYSKETIKSSKWFVSLIIVIFLIFMNIPCSIAITPESNPQYQGIDVSNWQGYIDYSRVREAGIEVVYIKASQGRNIKDAYFDLNYENAKSNGLKVGFYHFLTATTTEEAKLEAQFFASIISGKIPDCKLAMDYEIFGGVSPSGIQEIAQVFLETTKRLTNKEVVIYSDLFNSKSVFGEKLAQQYPLWIADYTNIQNLEDSSSNWKSWIGWQYTDRGIVAGIDGNVDRDIYTKEIFLDDSSDIPQIDNPNKTENNTKTFNYIVKRGDTLSKIAIQYGTTVEELASINQISNPNLIYVGQVIKVLENSTIPGKEERGLGSIVYTVKRGNTLSQIANAYGVTVSHIVQINDIENPNLIFPGEKLRITESRSNTLNELEEVVQNPTLDTTYIVRKGDTLWGISRKFGVSVDYLVRKNGIKNRNLIYIGEIIRI